MLASKPVLDFKFSAVMESSAVAGKLGIKIISDGGIQKGDIQSSLCRSCFVIWNPSCHIHAGDLIVENNIKYKILWYELSHCD